MQWYTQRIKQILTYGWDHEQTSSPDLFTEEARNDSDNEIKDIQNTILKHILDENVETAGKKPTINNWVLLLVTAVVKYLSILVIKVETYCQGQ